MRRQWTAHPEPAIRGVLTIGTTYFNATGELAQSAEENSRPRARIDRWLASR